MKTSFVIFPLVAVFGVTVGLVKHHFFIRDEADWNAAHYYCRKNYSDLSTIGNLEEHNSLTSIAGADTWIGLHRSDEDQNTFVWSDKNTSSYVHWLYGEPSSVDEKCVQMRAAGWFDDDCFRARAFFCEKILVLVKENKTWEEAYEYCTTNYNGLAYLNSQAQLEWAKIESRETQTDSVWTGLRFLAGRWLWVSGQHQWGDSSLPQCPAHSYRCGARNVKTDVWENRDCEEKLNFLCY